MDVDHVGRPGWICEDPLLGRAQYRPGVDPVWIKSQIVDRPPAGSLIKAKATTTVGSPMSGTARSVVGTKLSSVRC